VAPAPGQPGGGRVPSDLERGWGGGGDWVGPHGSNARDQSGFFILPDAFDQAGVGRRRVGRPGDGAGLGGDGGEWDGGVPGWARGAFARAPRLGSGPRIEAGDFARAAVQPRPQPAADAVLASLRRHGLGEDCPIFDGLFRFCQLVGGGTLCAARAIASGADSCAVHWAGGLHHAKRSEASGFCYVNDLVLGILELLRAHARVMYVDLDIHHGDGVEEAFWLSDRVLTVSVHKHGDGFFPGSGALDDVGAGAGLGHSVNIPLRDGCDDATFLRCLKPVIRAAMENYRPGAVVVQCGADSLGGDRLGCFSLSVEGHAEAVRFIRSFGLPTIATGGGGYTKAAVARCWAAETAALISASAACEGARPEDASGGGGGSDGERVHGRAGAPFDALGTTEDPALSVWPLPDALPDHLYREYHQPSYSLRAPPAFHVANANGRKRTERIVQVCCERLRALGGAPGVGLGEAPPVGSVPAEEAGEGGWEKG